MKLSAKFTVILLTLFATGFTGCGGKYEPINAFNNQAFTASLQGVFTGTTGASSSTDILLPTSFYSLYGTRSGNTFVANGIRVGTGAPSIPGGAFIGTYTDFAITGTAGGTIFVSPTDNDGISGRLHQSGTDLAVNTVRVPVAQYSYNAFANIDFIQGGWSGISLDGSSASLSIGFDGKVTGISGGCAVTGTVTPAASGRNFFNVQLTDDTACTSAGAITSAVAVRSSNSAGDQQLLIIGSKVVATTSGTRTVGILFAANR